MNKHQYNEKETNDDFGLWWSDYGARWYDPQNSRWTTIDPLAEKYAAWSGYNYVMGNPIRLIDPTGMFGEYYDQNGIFVYDDQIDDGRRYVVDNADSRNVIFELPISESISDIHCIVDDAYANSNATATDYNGNNVPVLEYELSGAGYKHNKSGEIMIRGTDGDVPTPGVQPVTAPFTPHTESAAKLQAFIDSKQTDTNGRIYGTSTLYSWHTHPEHYGTIGAGMPSAKDLRLAQDWFRQNHFVLSVQDNKVYFYNYKTTKGNNVPPNSGLGTDEMGGYSGSFPLDVFFNLGNQ